VPALSISFFASAGSQPGHLGVIGFGLDSFLFKSSRLAVPYIKSYTPGKAGGLNCEPLKAVLKAGAA